MSKSTGTDKDNLNESQNQKNISPAEDTSRNDYPEADQTGVNVNKSNKVINVHPTQKQISRRKFLGNVGLALSGVGAVAVAAPIVGFIVAPLFQTGQPQWRKVGAVTDFEVGKTQEVKFEDSSPRKWAGAVSQTAAWLRREDEQTFKAFSIDCTHLGCPVSWQQQSELYFCPCHGGVYYKDGSVAAGPPPHPLPEYPVRVNNGQVEIFDTPIPLTVIGKQILGK